MSASAAAARGPRKLQIRPIVEHVLSRHYRRPCRVAQLQQRLCPYSSSFRIDELDVRLDDGRQVRLMMKDLGRGGFFPEARKARPEFLYEPRREIEAYRDVLRRRIHGTPLYYGTFVDESIGRYWMFLERVPGLELRHVGDFRAWEAVARWLGRFHRHSESRAVAALGRRGSRFIRYDAAFFQIWIERALTSVRHRARRPSGVVAALERLAGRYSQVTAYLAALPRTIIHGEFYACNVVVQNSSTGRRVCPVDWEMTAVGPGLIDVAALTAGVWTDAERRRLVAAYYAAVTGDERAHRRVPGDIFTALDYCRLHLGVRMLGWAGEYKWRPPADHAQDWLSEVIRLARKIPL